LCEEVPRQKAAESRKIPESGSVIPREGVESVGVLVAPLDDAGDVIPREGVERVTEVALSRSRASACDPERVERQPNRERFRL
jgi:hypothetical protein